MSDTVIISLAPVAADCPRVIPEELAQEILASVEYGAAIVHLHVRDKQGRLTPDTVDFQATIDPVIRHSNLIIQASTGGVSSLSIAERCAPLACSGVEMASLNVGSVNLGDAVYFNPGPDVEYCAKQIITHNIIPEFEVFEIGMINNILALQGNIKFKTPMLFNIVLGHRGSTPATVDALIAMRSMLPREALWGITHFGRKNFDIIAAAVAMGASEVRIGFEDSYYLSAEEKAHNNYQQVAKLATLIRSMDKKVATPDIARQMLSIPPRQQ
ncbi:MULTISPECIES: BKACE family enzyme [Klebsiella]|uniref:3-keto-5-aminohexanoate cleavage enzyme n=1 Tax=Klebsiella pasteurii TaxID=2587529 RepID=A0A9Q9S3F8_9ENTR|nr:MULTISPECIES: 3-keto-5-aminohexanoate cleavage protein [Klebsiella]MDV0997366.1 3-keto-5-aminohexanoate cleavage protein [Klebsiella pasteurii]VUS23873.1 3-keto-5-aminohexanoate cleavage enzyme [Klebsiella pasteurii]VUS65613.1 3-keto-5-aminohexanoate cleavage enzyme [Klebsiella pasteurii]